MRENKFNIILSIYFIGISSFPFFVGDIHLIIGLIVILFLNIIKFGNVNTTVKFLGFISFFFLLFFIQIAALGDEKISPYIAFFLRLVLAYFGIKLLGAKLPKLYVKSIYILSLIGLFFYIVISIFPSIGLMLENISENFLVAINPSRYEVNPNIILFTIEDSIYSSLPRNSGPFWEPGAFSSFLIIALIFNIFITGKLFCKQNNVFILSIITTFSLAGYLSLSIVFIGYFLNKKQFSYLFFLIPFFIVLSITSFNQFEFLSGKFEKRYNKYEARKGQANYNKYKKLSRFESTEIDIRLFLKNPIIGSGLNIEGNVRNTNTISTILRDFGVFAFVLIFINLYLTMKNKLFGRRKDTLFVVLMYFALLSSLLSQGLGNKPFFIGLYLFNLLPLHLLNEKHESIKDIKVN